MKFQFQSYEQLLNHYNELEIVNKYLPGVELNKHFHSPLRNDPDPSALIYIGNRGRLRFADYGRNINEDIPGLIALLYNESSASAFRRIFKDFSGISNTTPIKYNKPSKKATKYVNKPTIIKPFYRPWKHIDEWYWNECGGVPREFLYDDKVKVFPVSKVFISNNKGERTIKCDKIAYAFIYHTINNIPRIKIYQPFNTKIKWISNVTSGENGVLQLVNTLPKSTDNDLLIISTSLKDSAVIQANTISADMWIPSIGPNSESDFLPPQIVPKLNNRFKRILVWGDNDEAGYKFIKRFNQKYKYEGIVIPSKFKVKDPYEFRRKYGHFEFIQLMKYLIS